jgi:serine/threonine-protein kinase
MEGILAILFAVGGPMLYLILREKWRAENRKLELQARSPQLLLQDKQLLEEKQQLEARIQNLESIVCSVDFELNQRLSKLAAGMSQVGPAPQLDARPVSVATSPTMDAGYRLGHLTVGQTVLGRYHVKKELGRGGMGAVYLADDSKLGELVALKVISSIHAGDPDEARERFRREVQAARRVTHANVVRIHDLGEDGPLMFLSMEYVDGETLHARVKRGGPLPVGQAREVLGEVAAGVAAAHAVGVVHRDLKPQNVLLGGGGRIVKVIDFGLAKATFQPGSTATGIILGTPEYMAPEQIRGGNCDARTDVYALGATAYYALCGRPPFAGDTPIAIGFAQVHEQPSPPREHRPEVPQALESAVMRALAKDPKARFADASDFRAAIGIEKVT